MVRRMSILFIHLCSLYYLFTCARSLARAQFFIAYEKAETTDIKPTNCVYKE